MAPGPCRWARCWLVALALRAHAQVRVMSPASLVKQFAETDGRIVGSTATFGAPFYGDRVMGRLVYGDSLKHHQHCRDDDYIVPGPDPSLRGSNDNTEGRLINIIMVRRGNCSFTTKVKVAAAKGAHAVIIVDREDSTLSSVDLHNIIVADDGFGGQINIPSVLISKQDGARLIHEVKSSQVVVELAWDLPTNEVVKVDLWMSSASQESLKFLKEFSPRRKVLNEVMSFQPHYAVFSMDSSDYHVYNGLCLDESGEYCAEDPDGPGPLTGRDVLLENVRQLCIHALYKVGRSPRERVPQDGEPQQVAQYAKEYWEYIEKMLDRCPVRVDNPHQVKPDARFGEPCSHKLMKEVGIDMGKVKNCVDTTRSEKLKNEREHSAWSPRALRINGWRFSGLLDADLVTRAICSGFVSEQPECHRLIAPRDPFAPYAGSEFKAEPVSNATFFTWLCGTLLLMCVALCLYRRYLKQEMRLTLREEVMLEVRAQMGEYAKMQG